MGLNLFLRSGCLVVLMVACPLFGQSDRAEPGPEAAAAYELLESDGAEEVGQGCDSFLRQILEGSDDPWAYRGAALCAQRLAAIRERVASALNAQAKDSALRLFGRGYLFYLEEDMASAEQLLRQAVQRDAELALAWNALGAVVQRRGDAAAAVPMIEKALELAPELELARNNLTRARLYSGVFDRLEVLLKELPQRWDALPEPRPPLSGQGPNEVLANSTEEEDRIALRFISILALSPLDGRDRLIDAWLEECEPKEVDVWMPGLLALRKRLQSPRESALTVEAWLYWLEKIGRKDAALWAASDAIDLIVGYRGIHGVDTLLHLWDTLPPPEKAEPSLAKMATTRAQVLFRLGDNAGSLSAYRSARDLFEAVGDPLGQGNTFEGEADVLFRLGDNAGSLSAYRSARDLFEAVGSQLGQGNTWRGEADVLFRLGDSAGSLSAYRSARDFFEAVGDLLGQGNTWNREADVHIRLGAYDDALRASRSARQYYNAVGDQLGKGGTWGTEAEVLLKSGKSASAVEAARRAVELAAATDSDWNQIRALLVESRAYRDLGDSDKIVQLMERAIGIFNQWRGGFITDTQRTDKESGITSAYDLLIPTLWQLGQLTEALVRAEQARSRVLLDLISTGHAARFRDAPAALDLLQQREDIAMKLAKIDRELSQEPEPAEERKLRQDQYLLDEKRKQLGFEILLSAESPLAIGDALDENGIRSAVDEIGPVLLYYVAAAETFVFLLRPGSEPLAKALPLSWGELGHRARQLAEWLANPNYEHQATDDLKALWSDLLGPMADLLPARGPLVVIPHGPLHQIPFEALVDPEGRPLFQSLDLSVAPSISTLHHVRTHHHPSKPQDGFVAFASGEGLTLPSAEIRTIAGFFDPRHVADFEPTRAYYRFYERLAPRARHLLIASQGVHTPGNRSLTYLEIEPSDVHDRRLTAAEIASLPLDAELVTLAACDTAYAEALLSDERLDLTRAFLVAGAAAVLATRWKVPEDDRTSRFLVDFYRAYRQGGPDGRGMRKDEALTEARRRSRERGDPARIWAAWVLVGDAR